MLKSGALPDLRDWSLAPNVSFGEIERRIILQQFDLRISAYKAHLRRQAGGRPNLSFSEFERRISASGTFSASAWGQTEFKLQRLRAPNFGVRHIFGFSLGADRIQASGNSSAEFGRQAHFRLQPGGQTDFKLQGIRAPNLGVRHIFGFSLGGRPISSFREFERRI